jgi:hypothetical protein
MKNYVRDSGALMPFFEDRQGAEKIEEHLVTAVPLVSLP